MELVPLPADSQIGDLSDPSTPTVTASVLWTSSGSTPIERSADHQPSRPPEYHEDDGCNHQPGNGVHPPRAESSTDPGSH